MATDSTDDWEDNIKDVVLHVLPTVLAQAVSETSPLMVTDKPISQAVELFDDVLEADQVIFWNGNIIRT